MRYQHKDMEAAWRSTSAGLWDSFHYMVGDCYYGGKISDEWDRRTVNSLLVDLVCNDTALGKRALIPTMGDDFPADGTNRPNPFSQKRFPGVVNLLKLD